jgi:hypothetical protein
MYISEKGETLPSEAPDAIGAPLAEMSTVTQDLLVGGWGNGAAPDDERV